MPIDKRPLFDRPSHLSALLRIFHNLRYLRRRTIKSLVRLLRRVLYPFVGTPHGVTGWRPPDVLPSPPPCGWSTGFIATPRTRGRLPSQRVRPALPMEIFSWSA